MTSRRIPVTLSMFHSTYSSVPGSGAFQFGGYFAASRDRLFATRDDQNEDATAAGRHIKSSRTVGYVRK